jgi:hypothetical protein
MANNISLSNVLNISIAAVQPGLGLPNTGNLAIFSREAYASSFGTAGFKIYFSPAQAALDWGTGSNTYQMVLAAFTIQPNVLAIGGYVVVIPYLSAAQNQQVTVAFPGLPASGDWYISYNGALSAALVFNETAVNLQTALQSVSGLSSATATGSVAAGFAINAGSTGVGHPFVVLLQFVFTVSSANATQGATYTDSAGNIYTVQTTIAGQTTLTTSGLPVAPPVPGTLTKASGTGDATITWSAVTTLADSNAVPVLPTVTVNVPGSTAETFDQAIIRAQPLVAFFGVMSAEIDTTIVNQAAAAYIQSQRMIGACTDTASSALNAGGNLQNITALQLTQMRPLYYDGTTTQALVYMATYMSLLLSVDYTGSNTTLNMNLKTLAGVAPDPNITQALVTAAGLAGADVYVNLSGVPKVISSGANDFADNQTNLQAFALGVLVAYFNTLATTNTKIPQTEAGLDTIKGSIKAVCQQYVTNGFLAPGVWTNPTVFGPSGALLNGIAQFGFYIFSSPIATQSPAQRNARIAPPIQIAIKYAGGINKGSAVIFLNP